MTIIIMMEACNVRQGMAGFEPGSLRYPKASVRFNEPAEVRVQLSTASDPPANRDTAVKLSTHGVLDLLVCSLEYPSRSVLPPKFRTTNFSASATVAALPVAQARTHYAGLTLCTIPAQITLSLS